MLIRFEYFHIVVLPLFAATTIVAIPTCEDIITTSNGSVMYMEADYEAKHSPGTAALMICKFGYVSSLPFLVFCQANGTWNHKLGECILTNKACNPQNTESKVIYMPPKISDIYPSGTFAMLHCSIGQLLVGPSSAICLDGKWNAELGYCKELNSDGIFSGSDQRHDISINDFEYESETIDTATVAAVDFSETIDTATVASVDFSETIDAASVAAVDFSETIDTATVASVDFSETIDAASVAAVDFSETIDSATVSAKDKSITNAMQTEADSITEPEMASETTVWDNTLDKVMEYDFT